jgi:hypothetical protein
MASEKEHSQCTRCVMDSAEAAKRLLIAPTLAGIPLSGLAGTFPSSSV